MRVLGGSYYANLDQLGKLFANRKPVRMRDKMMVQRVRYLNNNIQNCSIFSSFLPYLETRNYLKGNFDWSSEHFGDDILKR